MLFLLALTAQLFLPGAFPGGPNGYCAVSRKEALSFAEKTASKYSVPGLRFEADGNDFLIYIPAPREQEEFLPEAVKMLSLLSAYSGEAEDIIVILVSGNAELARIKTRAHCARQLLNAEILAEEFLNCCRIDILPQEDGRKGKPDVRETAGALAKYWGARVDRSEDNLLVRYEPGPEDTADLIERSLFLASAAAIRSSGADDVKLAFTSSQDDLIGFSLRSDDVLLLLRGEKTGEQFLSSLGAFKMGGTGRISPEERKNLAETGIAEGKWNVRLLDAAQERTELLGKAAEAATELLSASGEKQALTRHSDDFALLAKGDHLPARARTHLDDSMRALKKYYQGNYADAAEQEKLVKTSNEQAKLAVASGGEQLRLIIPLVISDVENKLLNKLPVRQEDYARLLSSREPLARKLREAIELVELAQKRSEEENATREKARMPDESTGEYAQLLDRFPGQYKDAPTLLWLHDVLLSQPAEAAGPAVSAEKLRQTVIERISAPGASPGKTGGWFDAAISLQLDDDTTDKAFSAQMENSIADEIGRAQHMIRKFEEIFSRDLLTRKVSEGGQKEQQRMDAEALSRSWHALLPVAESSLWAAISGKSTSSCPDPAEQWILHSSSKENRLRALAIMAMSDPDNPHSEKPGALILTKRDIERKAKWAQGYSRDLSASSAMSSAAFLPAGDSAESHLLSGASLSIQGDFKKACSEFESAARSDRAELMKSSYMEVYASRVITGNIIDDVLDGKDSLSVSEDYPAALKVKALTMLHLSRMAAGDARAADPLAEAMQISPGSACVCFSMGASKLMAGDYSSAEQYFGKALASRPAYRAYRTARAACAAKKSSMEEQDAAKVLAKYAGILEMDPLNPVLVSSIGSHLYRMGIGREEGDPQGSAMHKAEGLALIRSALKTAPGLSGLQLEALKILYRESGPDKLLAALPEYASALRGCAESETMFGEALLDKGDCNQAIEHLESAYAYSRTAREKLLLGRAHCGAGLNDSGMKLLAEALAEGVPEADYYIGLCNWQTGNILSAGNHFEGLADSRETISSRSKLMAGRLLLRQLSEER